MKMLPYTVWFLTDPRAVNGGAVLRHAYHATEDFQFHSGLIGGMGPISDGKQATQSGSAIGNEFISLLC